jgi:hypothetical protein
MRKIRIIFILLILLLPANGQTPVGSWSDHLAYNTAKSLAIGSTEVYVSTGSSILVYNKTFAELRKLSRTNGLSESGISAIAWSEEIKTLIISYTSGNVDLMKGSIIYNIPDISRKYIPGNKEINRIRTNGKYAYLASSFGIVVIDINKREIYDTWKPGDGSSASDVWDITFGNNKIYAATSSGVYSADLSNPGLAYFGSWNLISTPPNPAGKYTALVFSGSKLYANLSVPYSAGDNVYIIDGGSSLFSYIPGVYNTAFDPATNGFTISSSTSVRYYLNGVLSKTITSYGSGLSLPNISQAVVEGGNIWIADLGSGLVRGENMSAFSTFSLPGPVSNNAYSITSYNGRTIIGGGGGDGSWNNLWRPLEISVFENNGWTTVLPGTIKDPMRALIDPDDNNHFFVSTWGGGLLEYQNNLLKKQYKESNSPMQTIIAGQPYVRICGMALDKSKNLWITQSGVTGSIKVLKPDGSWIVNPLTIDVPTIGDILIAKNGYKWIVLPRGYGLFVLDDNNTPDVFADDRSKKMLVKDIEGRTISSVYSIAEDLDGNIWVGTDQGPLIYYNSEKLFTSELSAFHIKIPRNDGTDLADYMLGTEIITSIEVDGANRKWLGTFSSGAYLLSPDGTKQIKNFNEQNSPILSNSIVALSVDNKTGDVWFGTAKGVQSIRGDATTGEDKFTNVYTFPNPVREDFTGNVTIKGLMRDSQIRITDISGNLVYQTASDGGLATWDLKTYNGRRVATGVYLVFCASSDGEQSCVTKMLVIK